MTTGQSRADDGFEAWVVARSDALLRFAYLVTGSRAEAEDALQDALASACARWDRIARADDPDAYVRRMIANAHVSWWRKARRREAPVAEVRRDDHAPDPAAGVEARAVWDVCAELPRRQRAAVVLRFHEGLTNAEVAAVLGVAEVTVRTQVHRALATLRERLEEER